MNKEEHNTYLSINVIAAIAFALIFFWILFDPVSIMCVYKEIGLECPTCGLTRAFKAVLSAEFNNPHITENHLKIILFFCTQFLIRMLLSFYLFLRKGSSKLAYCDIAFGCISFVYAFMI